jgi:hypothetical protein
VLALLPMLPEAYNVKHFYSVKGASEATCLSLVISNRTFMYALFSGVFENVIELCHVNILDSGSSESSADHVRLLLNNYQLANKNFAKVNITILNNELTLVPEAYAGAEGTLPILNFSTGIDSSRSPLQHHVQNALFCYSIESELHALLERSFPGASIRHSGAVSIQLFFSQHSLVNSDIFLNIFDGYIEIVAKKSNSLLFYNVFSVTSNEDILYYLLFMMEQFQMDPGSVKLSLASQRAANDELINVIKKYIRNVELSVSDPSLRMKGELSSLPQHYYFTLLNQHLCEL